MKFNKIYEKQGLTIDILFELEGSNEDINKNIIVFDNILKNYDIKDYKLIIKYFRNLFQDFKEKELKININLNKSNIYMTFISGTLTEFDKIDKGLGNTFNIRYEANKGISYSHSASKYNLSNKLNSDMTKNYIDSFIEEITEIENIKPTKQTDNVLLATIYYKIFYGVFPDLKDQNIKSKIKSMLYILCKYHILDNIDLNEYTNNLMEQIVILVNGKQISNMPSISEDKIKIVKKISSEIHNYLKDFSNNKWEELRLICNADYFKEIYEDLDKSEKEENEKRLSLINRIDNSLKITEDVK